jgi:hypothetical protein
MVYDKLNIWGKVVKKMIEQDLEHILKKCNLKAKVHTQNIQKAIIYKKTQKKMSCILF